MKKRLYKILWNTDPDGLAFDVKVHLKDGWKLHGSLIVMRVLDRATHGERRISIRP